jgi:ribosome-associated heat shock protein Hsp15
VRLDVFLWRVRLSRSRQAACDLIREGQLRIERDGFTRRIERPSTEVVAGDVISGSFHTGVRVIRVVGLPDRRGPAREAATFVEEIRGRQPAHSACSFEGTAATATELTFNASASISPVRTGEL